MAGETLNIYLSGIATNDATLHFSNEDYNLTLVKRGLVVGNSHPDFMGRIKITSGIISVLSVNVSDVGNYTLSDGLNRKAKIIYMRLVGEFLLGISVKLIKWIRSWTCEVANLKMYHLLWY